MAVEEPEPVTVLVSEPLDEGVTVAVCDGVCVRVGVAEFVRLFVPEPLGVGERDGVREGDTDRDADSDDGEQLLP